MSYTVLSIDKITVERWNSTTGDIASRLVAVEDRAASFDALEAQGIQASLDYIQNNVGPQIAQLQVSIGDAQAAVQAVIDSGIAVDSEKLGGQVSSYYASVDYVDTTIANIIGGAPAALDSFNELAAALSDDENFAASVTAQLSGKLSAADNLASLGDPEVARGNLGVTAALLTKPDIITGATVPEAKTTPIIVMKNTGQQYGWVEDLGLPNGGSYIALHDDTKLSVIAAGDPLPAAYMGDAVLWLATDKIYKWDAVASAYNLIRKNIVQTENSTPTLYAASADRHIDVMDTSITTTVEDVRIRVVFSVDYETHGNTVFYVKRSDGATITEISAPTAGARSVGIATASYDGANSTTGDRLHIEFLNTVSTVGTYTYQLWARGENATLAINRTIDDTNNTSVEHGMAFTILEEIV